MVTAASDLPIATGDELHDPVWAFWCPPEGEHIIHPDELQVGILEDSRVALLAAVVPPFGPLHEGRYRQAEGFARVIRDELADGPWTEPDGVADWMAAHGLVLNWPEPLASASTG